MKTPWPLGIWRRRAKSRFVRRETSRKKPFAAAALVDDLRKRYQGEQVGRIAAEPGKIADRQTHLDQLGRGPRIERHRIAHQQRGAAGVSGAHPGPAEDLGARRCFEKILHRLAIRPAQQPDPQAIRRREIGPTRHEVRIGEAVESRTKISANRFTGLGLPNTHSRACQNHAQDLVVGTNRKQNRSRSGEGNWTGRLSKNTGAAGLRGLRPIASSAAMPTSDNAIQRERRDLSKVLSRLIVRG